MGKVNVELFKKLVVDFEARHTSDRPNAKRKPKNKWGKDGGKVALYKNDQFKDYLFKAVMIRAREYLSLHNPDDNSDGRNAIVNIQIEFSDELFHPGDPFVEYVFIKRDAADSDETWDEIRDVNRNLVLGCGPDN